MPLLAKARSFFRNLFFFDRRDSDLDQELRSHLEMLIEENIRAGMPPGEAQRAARIELGGSEQVKEQVREVRMATGFTPWPPIAAMASGNFEKTPALRPWPS
jgi:hypothetical protein